MASLRQLVLVVGLAFLVLAAEDHGRGGPAGGAPAIGAAAAVVPPAPPEAVVISQQPPQPLSGALAEESKRLLIPPSGPSDKWNYEANHEKPSSAAESGSGRRRTRSSIDGRRLGSP